MKQIILFACMVLFMTSCSEKTYYQIVDVKSTNLQKENNRYVYTDDVCKVVYDFWDEGGNAGFYVENLSQEVIYVDLSHSFFTKNNIAYNYYQARSYGIGHNIQVTNGNSVSSTIYGDKPITEIPGSTTSQSFNSVSYGSNSNLTFSEEPIVAIPPHTSKSFSEYKIMGEFVLLDRAVRLKVKKGQPEGKTFEKSETPINFSNYITYRLGEKGEAKAITNNFYIGGFMNYLSSDIMGEGYYRGKEISLRHVPDRFYIEYNNKYFHNFTAEEKTKYVNH